MQCYYSSTIQGLPSCKPPKAASCTAPIGNNHQCSKIEGPVDCKETGYAYGSDCQRQGSTTAKYTGYFGPPVAPYLLSVYIESSTEHEKG